MEKYIMAIDQGTTSSRAILFNHDSEIVTVAQKEFTQYFKHPGWVEHDANEIWLSVLAVIAQALQTSNIQPSQVAAIGITNQRETTVVWNKETGLPIYNAIVWQSRQTVDICDDLKRRGYEELFKEKTGLRIDPYFSATKIRWILDHVEGAQELAEEGKLLAGTIDSWLIYCLTGGKVHATDYSNASRTLLYNIFEQKWDEELCKILHIPMAMLPDVRDSSGDYGTTVPYHFFGQHVPICGVAGDQQAALFGQNCFDAGYAKNTYGTGCFLLMNTGETPRKSSNGLVTTIAWGYKGKVTYALEGSVFVAGSAIQWLRDQMEFFDHSKDSEALALQSEKDSGVVLVPAFVGLGAPYWDDRCRGALFGITRGTTRADITRATIESLAFQTRDVLEAMQEDTNCTIPYLKVDGGACANNYMMQFQSDLLQVPVKRPKCLETTALGAAHLAGLYVGFWDRPHDFINQGGIECEFKPSMDIVDSNRLYKRWQMAVDAARMFPSIE